MLVWDPGYPPARELLGHRRIEAVPVPVDTDGMLVTQAVKSLMDARGPVVTQAQQSPLCVSLSLPRRLALREWATRQQAWGEYRYISRPRPALKYIRHDLSEHDQFRQLMPERLTDRQLQEFLAGVALRLAGGDIQVAKTITIRV